VFSLRYELESLNIIQVNFLFPGFNMVGNLQLFAINGYCTLSVVVHFTPVLSDTGNGSR